MIYWSSILVIRCLWFRSVIVDTASNAMFRSFGYRKETLCGVLLLVNQSGSFPLRHRSDPIRGTAMMYMLLFRPLFIYFLKYSNNNNTKEVGKRRKRRWGRKIAMANERWYLLSKNDSIWQNKHIYQNLWRIPNWSLELTTRKSNWKIILSLIENPDW